MDTINCYLQLLIVCQNLEHFAEFNLLPVDSSCELWRSSKKWKKRSHKCLLVRDSHDVIPTFTREFWTSYSFPISVIDCSSKEGSWGTDSKSWVVYHSSLQIGTCKHQTLLNYRHHRRSVQDSFLVALIPIRALTNCLRGEGIVLLWSRA